MGLQTHLEWDIKDAAPLLVEENYYGEIFRKTLGFSPVGGVDMLQDQVWLICLIKVYSIILRWRHTPTWEDYKRKSFHTALLFAYRLLCICLHLIMISIICNCETVVSRYYGYLQTFTTPPPPPLDSALYSCSKCNVTKNHVLHCTA